MAVEAVRGCGYRKVGGLYLCGQGFAMGCDRLPYELVVCPTCGAGVKFTRGFTWLDWAKYAYYHEGEETEHLISVKAVCRCSAVCPVCWPLIQPQPYGLLWVGEQFYTTQSFIQEALEMGVSRRIAVIPRNLKLGETWIVFAHKSACGTRLEEQDDGTTKQVGIPGIFYAHRPTSLELLIWESDATEEKLAELEKKGITPVIIPDGDVDHDPSTPLKMSEEDRFAAESSYKIATIRAMMKR